MKILWIKTKEEATLKCIASYGLRIYTRNDEYFTTFSLEARNLFRNFLQENDWEETIIYRLDLKPIERVTREEIVPVKQENRTKTWLKIVGNDENRIVSKANGYFNQMTIEALQFSLYLRQVKLRLSQPIENRGRVRIKSHRKYIEAVLQLAGMSYTFGNDHREGGSLGDYFLVGQRNLSKLILMLRCIISLQKNITPALKK